MGDNSLVFIGPENIFKYRKTFVLKLKILEHFYDTACWKKMQVDDKAPESNAFVIFVVKYIGAFSKFSGKAWTLLIAFTPLRIAITKISPPLSFSSIVQYNEISAWGYDKLHLYNPNTI